GGREGRDTARGELTPAEAQSLSGVLETQRKAIETAESRRPHRRARAGFQGAAQMSRALHKRIAKLEAALKPPIRIVFRNICETPGVTAKRLISREEHGNIVFETWEGPIEYPRHVRIS